jgi:type II secretory pathway component PulL
VKFDRIKTEWASLRLTHEGLAIICVKSGNSTLCVLFENSEQLMQAIDKKKISVKKWIVSVPNNRCITKSVELPASDIGQAFKMLEFELPSYVPLPPEELVYGCTPIRSGDNLLSVLTYILKISKLESILEAYKTIGIKPARIVTDSIAVKEWFNQDEDNIGPGINFLLDQSRCLLLVGINGNLERLDEISFPDHDITDFKERIGREICDLKDEIIGIDKENISLKIAATKEIAQVIYSQLSDDFNDIKFLRFPEIDLYDDSKNLHVDSLRYDFVVAEGLLRVVKETRLRYLNLLPGKLIKKDEQKKLLTNCGATVALSLSLVFSLWLNFAVMNWRTARACHRIETQITPIEHIAAGVESKRHRVKAIQKQLSNRGQISRIFAELYKYSPKTISISELKFSSRTDAARISIKGQSKSLSNAFEYSDAMKDAKLLNGIQIINAQQIPKPGGSVVEFKADCLVRSD